MKIILGMAVLAGGFLVLDFFEGGVPKVLATLGLETPSIEGLFFLTILTAVTMVAAISLGSSQETSDGDIKEEKDA